MTFEFTNKESQISALVSFIDQQAEWRYSYETEHKDAANNYLMLLDGHCLDGFMRRESFDRYNDKLRAVIKTAMSEGIDGKKIWEAICECIDIRPGNMFCQYNVIEAFPVGEIEEQISGISGKVNGKDVSCVFSALTSNLSADELKSAAADINDAYWDGKRDCIYINTDHYWHFHVCPKKLQRKLRMRKHA